MSLFDNLKDALGGLLGQAADQAPGALTQALAGAGGLQGVIDKLQASGLGPQVTSWLGNGENLPVSASQLEAALGNEQVQQLATSLGIPADKVLAFLQQHLPTAVDQASPTGTLPPTS
ncbi:uncharacterized protein YidB (DUF937 family) [Labrys wisconsinensis]|uniref:Uncharacterized protein YidB (DUF937 family) n=2 Tax=Labrys wisconsinensis TaxID=425677 RepID=A0ABU0J631_9HYPH|nr:YidB family protein [Labrys wisconsinensis]MDQ0469721.1 uncharacterized protein YidB (DUF937 family) [Labrys wisconsinensis]